MKSSIKFQLKIFPFECKKKVLRRTLLNEIETSVNKQMYKKISVYGASITCAIRNNVTFKILSAKFRNDKVIKEKKNRMFFYFYLYSFCFQYRIFSAFALDRYHLNWIETFICLFTLCKRKISSNKYKNGRWNTYNHKFKLNFNKNV